MVMYGLNEATAYQDFNAGLHGVINECLAKGCLQQELLDIKDYRKIQIRINSIIFTPEATDLDESLTLPRVEIPSIQMMKHLCLKNFITSGLAVGIST